MSEQDAHGESIPAASDQHVATGETFWSRMRIDVWWIAICAICGAFQIFRGAPLDGGFFLVAALILLVDAAGFLNTIGQYRVPTVPRAFLVGVLLVVVVVVGLDPIAAPATAVTVLLVGACSMVVAWTNSARAPFSFQRHATSRRALRRAAVTWSLVGVALCLWEMSAFLLGMSSPEAAYDHPPLTDLIEPVIATTWGRCVGCALWLVAGWALLRRGRS